MRIAGRVSRERSPARQTNGAVAYGKTVWSWHPWLVSSRRRFAKLNRAMRAANSPATEARRIRLRGERGISRKTIAQGRPDAPADTCMLVCVFSAPIAHETAGASQHPAFPAPSDFWGLRIQAQLGRIAPRECESHVHPRHCERSEASIAPHGKNGLLRRFAPAMTCCDIKEPRRVGKASVPTIAASTRWWARCALPTLHSRNDDDALTTPVHSKTQTSSPAACSRPKSASA